MKKYSHIFSHYSLLKEIIVEEVFMETIEKVCGIPNIIISDRDPIFIGNYWTELFSY